MSDIPADIAATAADLEEAAHHVAALTAGEPSVLAELIADLAAGIRSRPLLVTAGDEIAELAAIRWIAAGRAVGIEVRGAADEPPPSPFARIHLHGNNVAAADYAGAVGDDAGGELVGDVIGQGHSAAARYQTLAVAGLALVAALGSETAE